MEAKYGLDKPLLEQYGTYLKDIVTRFDFGPSLKQRGRQVVDIISDGMKTSAKLGLIAAFGAMILGIVFGAVAALRRNRIIDKVIMVITTAFVSMPSFIMGSLLLIVFSVKLGWLPGKRFHNDGLDTPDRDPRPVPDGLYHPFDPLVHAGRAGAGLYPHG